MNSINIKLKAKRDALEDNGRASVLASHYTGVMSFNILCQGSLDSGLHKLKEGQSFIGSGKLLPSKGKAKVGFIILIDQVSLKGNNINQLELPLTITSSKEEEKRSGFTKYEASINGSLLENKFLIKGKHLPDFKINSQVILSGSLARTWSKNQFKRRFYLLVDHNKEVKK